MIMKSVVTKFYSQMWVVSEQRGNMLGIVLDS